MKLRVLLDSRSCEAEMPVVTIFLCNCNKALITIRGRVDAHVQRQDSHTTFASYTEESM